MHDHKWSHYTFKDKIVHKRKHMTFWPVQWNQSYQGWWSDSTGKSACTKHNHLNSISRTHMVGRGNLLPKVILWLSLAWQWDAVPQPVPLHMIFWHRLIFFLKDRVLLDSNYGTTKTHSTEEKKKNNQLVVKKNLNIMKAN